MDSVYSGQDRGEKKDYQQYLEAMDAISIEKVASASTFFDPKEGNTVVDVGMASGTSSAILAKLFPDMNIIGVDINPKMVEIAQSNYVLPNLSFREDDGEKLLSFNGNSINGFFNCSSIHHITSYNGYDTNRALNTLQRQVELLKDRGVIVVRDFVKPEEKEIILELSTIDKPDRPNDCDLLLLFSKTARSLAPQSERGFPIKEVKSEKINIRRFRLFLSDATEFIRRKDYYANWNVELQEEYGYFSQKEFEDIFCNLGLRVIVSTPIYNQWIINNRYKNQFCLYDLNGNQVGFPPTNYLIAGEKVSRGKQISLVRHLPKLEKPFLQYSSYKNKDTNEIYDVVSRPNEVSDILPYFRHGDSISILAKHGYPRPLVNVSDNNPILDSKYFSGYITECMTIGKTEHLHDILDKRFGIKQDKYRHIDNSLHYYTSPGGINERVSSFLLELNDLPQNSIPLTDGFSGFKESGFLNKYNARQLLNTAQTGALADARLELNIYQLFFKNEFILPNWLGERLKIKFEQFIEPVSFAELQLSHSCSFEKCDKKADFLTTQRVSFSEIGIEDSHANLEYVYPSTVSLNTVVTLPVFRKNAQIYVGLEIQDLPVPQIHTGNSRIITAPAKRLPKEVRSLHDLECYISNLKIGKGKIIRYSKLGEKYFPSLGVTTEQVYPYVVCLDRPDKSLKWVSLSDIYQHMDKIEDAHLLIALSRLIHMTSFLPQRHVRDLSFDNFVDFISDCFNLGDSSIITDNTLVEKDLGITGDDGDEFLIAIQDEFGINFCDETGSIEKAFNLNDNEYLFHGEGSNIFDLLPIPFWGNNKTYKVAPLTVKQLYEVVCKLKKDKL